MYIIIAYECIIMCVCLCGWSFKSYAYIFNSHERIGVLWLQKEYQCSSKSAVNIHHHYQTILWHHQGRWEERNLHLESELRREIQKGGHFNL